jgi:hypothetical protein
MDAGAARLLARAYRRPGVWAGTRLAGPAPEHVRWARAQGIDLYGRDPAAGGLARSRWMRAFIRSLYWQHKWLYREGEGLRPGDRRAAAADGKALQVEVGLMRLDRAAGGKILNRGRAVRIRVLEGGRAAQDAAKGLPAGRKIFDGGQPGPRWSDPEGRDW